MVSSARPPSGQQHEITFGEQKAVVVEVGGGIRSYEAAGRAVLDSYPVAHSCDGAHGTPLVPWPNRLADGQYSFAGKSYQVPLTEPEKHNAIHGLLRWRPWTAEEESEERVVMAAHLFPMQGYPFFLDVLVAYELSPEGLSVTTAATNSGADPLPYGAGQHPYLSPGSGRIDSCSLQLEASTRILTDEERQLPSGTEQVAGTEYDFRNPREIGELQVDYAFTDLARDADGRAWARLRGRDERTAEIWVDETYPIIEIYTGDTLAPPRRRLGLGTEPMTCPPNAFQSGDGVITIEPGESFVSRWGARLS